MNGLLSMQMFHLGRAYASFAAHARRAPNAATQVMWEGFCNHLFEVVRMLAQAGTDAEQELALNRLIELARGVERASGDQQLVEILRRLTQVAVV